jgi:hypothetical protein
VTREGKQWETEFNESKSSNWLRSSSCSEREKDRRLCCLTSLSHQNARIEYASTVLSLSLGFVLIHLLLHGCLLLCGHFVV